FLTVAPPFTTDFLPTAIPRNASSSKSRRKNVSNASRVTPFTSLHFMHEAAMSAMAEEIHKKCSSMDVEEFLCRFLPRGPPDTPDSNVAAFQKIAKKTAETAMYGPLINALAPFCVNMQLIDTHATPDPQFGDFNPDLLKPDIVVYKAKDIADPITQFSRIETMPSLNWLPWTTRSVMKERSSPIPS
ncbi:hypothetical protein ARMGADRAFT_1133629, partial [Armillaria gallica]